MKGPRSSNSSKDSSNSMISVCIHACSILVRIGLDRGIADAVEQACHISYVLSKDEANDFLFLQSSLLGKHCSIFHGMDNMKGSSMFEISYSKLFLSEPSMQHFFLIIALSRAYCFPKRMSRPSKKDFAIDMS